MFKHIIERTFLNELGNFVWDFKAYCELPKKLLLKNSPKILERAPHGSRLMVLLSMIDA